MNIEHFIKDKILIIRPSKGSLDIKEASALKDAVIDLSVVTGTKEIVLNLENLDFIDSSGLSCLLSLLRWLNQQGGELKLAKINRPLRTMFELVSLNKILETYHETDEAIHSFKQNN